MVEQILNYRLMEKYMEYQCQIFHDFIDFKKAFDRVWYEGINTQIIISNLICYNWNR